MVQPPQPWRGTYPQNKTNFQPKARIVALIVQNIHQGTIAVTTTVPHQYNNGLVVKFLNKDVGAEAAFFAMNFPITVTSPTTFTAPYPSNRIITPVMLFADQKYQCLPVGEINQKLDSAMNNEA